MNSQSSITVRKLNIDCQLPVNSEKQNEVAAKLRNISRKSLIDALTNCLQPLQESGEQIVLIKSLQLDMDIEIMLSEQDIATLWAEKIKKSLLQAINAPSRSSMAVFATPASYLSSALMDMVHGRAQQLWYYRYFNGLWALPLSAALRTALLDEPSKGFAALGQMQQRQLVELCGAFNDTDAQRVMDSLYSTHLASDYSVADTQIFVSVISNSYTLAHSVDGKNPQQILLLASLALQQQVALQPSKLAGLAECFSLLMQLRYRHVDCFNDILAALMQQQTSQLKQWLSVTQIAPLTPLLKLPANVLHCLAQPLQLDESSKTKKSTVDGLQNNFSSFGNAMLLLPQINLLPLLQINKWPLLKKQSALCVLRWLVLCTCQGTDKFSAAAHDPLLRDLCGVEPNVNLTEAIEWLNEQLTQQQVNKLYAALKQQVIDESRDTEDSLHCIQWQQDSSRILVQEDKQKGRWVDLSIERFDVNSHVNCDTANNINITQAMADFSALWPSSQNEFSEASSTCLVMLAEYTLKSFAFRMPGFARCSVNYLWQNFLCMSVTLVAEEEHINAYLSRVPMSVMLNMTGINRGNFQFTDYDMRMIHLQESG